jgi:16S rRNA (cytosine1407-C5)-methyltransferase
MARRITIRDSILVRTGCGMSLPDVFLERLRNVVPPERQAEVLAQFSRDVNVGLRLNPLRADPAATRAALETDGIALNPVSWSPLAFTVAPAAKRALTEHPAFARGDFYIQNLSSQLAPLLLDPQPGETVLDLAAAPGGKTCQMAALMANQGRISAVEPVRDRFFRLRANLDQQGVSIARTYLADGRAVGRKCPAMFDRVLLDAPCSSEARFDARDPDSYAHWSLRKVAECAHKQKRLLRAAWDALKPGGRLLYSTCSFAPEENETIVASLLKQVGEAAVVCPVPWRLDAFMPGLTTWAGKPLPEALRHAVRVLPDERFDGFFLCLIEKRADVA